MTSDLDWTLKTAHLPDNGGGGGRVYRAFLFAVIFLFLFSRKTPGEIDVFLIVKHNLLRIREP